MTTGQPVTGRFAVDPGLRRDDVVGSGANKFRSEPFPAVAPRSRDVQLRNVS
jgi:hypothetical protein